MGEENSVAEGDDDSEEGAIVRSLFRSTSSSSSSDDDDDKDHGDDDDGRTVHTSDGGNVVAIAEDEKNPEKTILHMDTVRLMREVPGAQIAQRLWPCAAYLATFVLDFVAAEQQQKKQGGFEDVVAPSEREASRNDCGADRWTPNGAKDVSVAREKLARLLKDVAVRSRPLRSEIGEGDCEEREIEGTPCGGVDEDANAAAAAGSTKHVLRVLELGAGVGLTGLKLATELSCRVLLTDLPVAMPLLERNVRLNERDFVVGEDAVSARMLAWGDDDEGAAATAALFKLSRVDRTSLSSTTPPVLILASDCVYYEELHLPLERTIFDLLSNANAASEEESVCLIAAHRRWKSDNAFYKRFGRCTRTETRTLVCDVLEERVSFDADHGGRSVSRIFAVRLVAR